MKSYTDTSQPADPDDRHPITVLSNIYLEIGLPLHAAVQAAIADFETIFNEDEADLCAA